MQFSQSLSNLEKRINKEIKKFFDQKISETRASFEGKVLYWLKEYSLRKAKRIRPILVYYGYCLAGGKNKETILKTSIFIELIHNYLLIHDDIIDKDEVRRGKKSLHCLYGTDMAIVAGDMAAALGYEILSSAKFPAKNRLLAVERLNKTLYSTCYGQMLELLLRNKAKSGKKISDGDVLTMNTKKTAFYTLVTPLQIGALLAGTNESFLKKIERFALPLGIAFQIRDDLQDGDIEEVFGFSREKYQKKQEQLVAKAKKILKHERAFPKKEKEFLLNLADYCRLK